MTMILVVDDSAVDRRLAGGLLENAGWTVLYANDGQDALTQIESHLPDVVLTDLQMPGMNGLELVEAVKESYPLIPIILMTSKGSEEIAVRALRMGASSYVPKRRLATDLTDTIKLVRAASRESRMHTRLIMHRMTGHECTFELENDLTLIPSLISYFQRTVKGTELLDDTDCLRVGVALEEALMNAVYHGNLEVKSQLREQNHRAYYDLAKQRMQEQPYRDRRVVVTARITRLDATYIIRDGGPGFDPDELPDPTDPANLDRPFGRGLLLMHTFMDEVKYNDMGNEVTLVKRASDSGLETEPAAD